MIEEDGGLVMEEELGCCSCSACRRPVGTVRGFGVFEGGPTLEEDAQRDLQDRVVGMESPLLIAGSRGNRSPSHSSALTSVGPCTNSASPSSAKKSIISAE